MKKFKFEKKHNLFIHEHYKSISSRDLVNIFNEEFGTSLKMLAIQNFKKRHKLKSGYNTQFKKGDVPYSKGKKWDEFKSKESQAASRKTTFKKNMIPKNHRPVGNERVRIDGYVEIKTKEPSTWERKQRVIWEEYNGPIPKQHRIIFLDQNKHNFSLDNLKAVSYGVSAVMNKKGLFSTDTDVTEAGILMSKILVKSNKLIKELKEKK